MEKIFLSHSSEDKEYVRVLVKYLGRSKVVFDEIDFQTGIDFRDSIRRGLDASTVFAFLASKASLSSYWCKWEWQNAELLQIKEKLQSCLCIIIDHDVEVKDLPVWMQYSKVIKQTKPSLAYIDIQSHAISHGAKENQISCLGRETEKKTFKDALTSTDLEKQIFIFHGIEGIGRKSLNEKVCEEYLSSAVGPILIIEENYREEDVYLLLSEYAGLSLTKDNIADELNIFRGLSEVEKHSNIQKRMAIIMDSGHTPCLYDRGGMLLEDGSFKSTYLSLLSNIKNNQTLSVIVRRKPKLPDEISNNAILVRVGPLELNDMILILRLLNKRSSLGLSNEQIAEICSYLDGYPPSAYFSAEFIKEYGTEVFLKDKSFLVDFKAKRFLKFIREISLSDEEKTILKYLAGENNLTIETISIALNYDIAFVASTMKRLIDLSLINNIQNKYIINKPISDTVHRVLGLLQNSEYSSITKRLTEAYWQSDELSPNLDVVDATFHALYRGGTENMDNYATIVRPSILHDISQQAYYNQEWKKSLEYTNRALRIDENNPHLLELRFKALVKLEAWEEAENTLLSIKETASYHYFYLSGFLLKSRKKIDAALQMFQKALDTGDRSIPVYRDYAECWFQKGQYSKSISLLDSIYERSLNNPFIIDLYVKNYLELKDSGKALKYLGILETIDIDNKFIEHRRARYFSLIGNKEQAVIHAQNAYNAGQERFEVIAEIASIFIDLGKIVEAKEYLLRLSNKFPNQKKDVQNGLHMKLAIKEENIDSAQICYDKIIDKTLVVIKLQYQKLLELKLRIGNISLSEGAEIKAKIEAIRKEIPIQPSMIIDDDSSST